MSDSEGIVFDDMGLNESAETGAEVNIGYIAGAFQALSSFCEKTAALITL